MFYKNSDQEKNYFEIIFEFLKKKKTFISKLSTFENNSKVTKFHEKIVKKEVKGH